MGLLRGSASVSRYKLVSAPDVPDFERRAFTEIPQASEIRESVGFLPFEPAAPYEVGTRRFAFRVRIDRRKPDATAVRERLQELVRSELEASGRDFVGSRRRKELRQLAEDEHLARATPRSKIIECCIDGSRLWVGSTAKTDVGVVLQVLRAIGVVADHDAPWSAEQNEVVSDLDVVREPGQSVLGCRFVKALLGDEEVMVEPVSGSVRLVTREAKVSLTGEILPELLRYVDQGAEILSAKLVVGDLRFRFDAPSYRIQSLRVETERQEHWTQLLDARLERIASLHELLDGKFVRARPRLDTVDVEEPAPPVLAAAAPAS